MMIDDPSWRKALASPEREYWVAGAREELRSLKDLQVFALVPRLEIPRGKRVLKGKLVCKRKRDDTGNITRYKGTPRCQRLRSTTRHRFHKDHRPHCLPRVPPLKSPPRRFLTLEHPAL